MDNIEKILANTYATEKIDNGDTYDMVYTSFIDGYRAASRPSAVWVRVEDGFPDKDADVSLRI